MFNGKFHKFRLRIEIWNQHHYMYLEQKTKWAIWNNILSNGCSWPFTGWMVHLNGLAHFFLWPICLVALVLYIFPCLVVLADVWVWKERQSFLCVNLQIVSFFFSSLCECVATILFFFEIESLVGYSYTWSTLVCEFRVEQLCWCMMLIALN